MTLKRKPTSGFKEGQSLDDLIGQVFSKLTVVELADYYVKPSDGKKEKRYLCSCSCGGSCITSKRKLEIGHTTSCGCNLRTRGGMSKVDKLSYVTWNMIVQRTTNESFDINNKYIGRGIGVTDRWLGQDGFNNFLVDMGSRPSKNHTIERVDVFGGYCAKNCVWTDDKSLQAFNQRRRKSNTSGKTGVVYDAYKGVWCATITKGDDKRRKVCASFEQACRLRDTWEVELYGFLKSNDR